MLADLTIRRMKTLASLSRVCELPSPLLSNLVGAQAFESPRSRRHASYRSLSPSCPNTAMQPRHLLSVVGSDEQNGHRALRPFVWMDSHVDDRRARTSVAASMAPQLRIQLVNDENGGSFMRSVRGMGIPRSSPSS